VTYLAGLSPRRRLITRFDWWFQALAWPSFECKDCTGAGLHYGCYCAYYEAIAPGYGPDDWHMFLRAVHGFLFVNSSPYWSRFDER
jgi:hypothetical protein